MFDILSNTIEWRSWGWNLVTITFLFTILFTLIDGWGYKKQGETIWAHRKAESVSVITFVYSACLCYSYTIYAIFAGNIAVLFNGIILGYNVIPILRGLFKLKKFNRTEKIVCGIFSLMIPAMLFLPWKELMFFAFMSGALPSLATQPLEMWRKKSARDVDIRTMIVFALGVFFWASYGFAVWVIYDFAIEKITLALTNSIAFLLFSTVIFLWFRYQRETLTFKKFLLLFSENNLRKKEG